MATLVVLDVVIDVSDTLSGMLRVPPAVMVRANGHINEVVGNDIVTVVEVDYIEK